MPPEVVVGNVAHLAEALRRRLEGEVVRLALDARRRSAIVLPVGSAGEGRHGCSSWWTGL
jgi:hypothetical protein